MADCGKGFWHPWAVDVPERRRPRQEFKMVPYDLKFDEEHFAHIHKFGAAPE